MAMVIDDEFDVTVKVKQHSTVAKKLGFVTVALENIVSRAATVLQDHNTSLFGNSTEKVHRESYMVYLNRMKGSKDDKDGRKLFVNESMRYRNRLMRRLKVSIAEAAQRRQLLSEFVSVNDQQFDTIKHDVAEQFRVPSTVKECEDEFGLIYQFENGEPEQATQAKQQNQQHFSVEEFLQAADEY